MSCHDQDVYNCLPARFSRQFAHDKPEWADVVALLPVATAQKTAGAETRAFSSCWFRLPRLSFPRMRPLLEATVRHALIHATYCLL